MQLTNVKKKRHKDLSGMIGKIFVYLFVFYKFISLTRFSLIVPAICVGQGQRLPKLYQETNNKRQTVENETQTSTKLFRWSDHLNL